MNLNLTLPQSQKRRCCSQCRGYWGDEREQLKQMLRELYQEVEDRD